MSIHLQLRHRAFERLLECRAATDAEHPAVDVLYPLMTAMADFEDALLQPEVLPDEAWGSQDDQQQHEQQQQKRQLPLPHALAAVQGWRAALWRAVHGPLHAPASAATSAPSDPFGEQQHQHHLDAEQLTWTWVRMDKALAALLSHPAVSNALTAASAGSAAARLDYLRSQMSDALGLSRRPAKPLAWRGCGKPVLPSTEQLLGAGVQGRVVAAAVAAAALDPQGRPQGLGAAGLDLDRLILEAAAAAAQAEAEQAAAAARDARASNGGEEDEAAAALAASAAAAAETAVAARTVEELYGEEAPAVRQRTAAAVSLTLATDPVLRRAVGRGLAMLGSLPLMEALRPGSGAMATAGAQQPGGSGATLSEQGAGIAAALGDSLGSRARDAVASVLEHPAEEEWLMRQMAREAAAAPSAPAAALLLPSAWMVSPSCRQLQLGLLGLQDCYSLRGQLPLLSELCTTAVQWAEAVVGVAAGPAGPGGSGQEGAGPLVVLQRVGAAMGAVEGLLERARAAVGYAMEGSSRSGVDVAACQQLVWVLEDVLQQQDQQQQQAVAVAASRSKQRGKGAQQPQPQQLDWQQLCRVVIPALAHEMWVSWHTSTWRNCYSSGGEAGGLGAPAAPHGLLGSALARQLPSGPAALDRPLASACALRLLHSSASLVQSKAMRLRQLRAAVATVLQQRQKISSTDSTNSITSSLQVADVPSSEPPVEAEWQGLGCLFVQLLLSHAPSLPQQHQRDALRMLCSQLLSLQPPAPEDLCQQLLSLLQHSTHSTLVELLQQLVLPAARAVAEGLLLCTRAINANTSTGRGGGGSSSAAAVLQAAARQRAEADAALALRGRAWALVGLLRLQLVVPPLGIDPAGKHALKAHHLEQVVLAELQPEIQVGIICVHQVQARLC